MSKIGILGGSFNPVHNGHLYIAEEIKRQLGLDKVIFIPTGIAPHKDNSEFAPKEHRYNMVCLAVGDRFEVSDIEVSSDSVCYAVDTMSRLKDIYFGDELFYIIGADSLADFTKWREPQKLFDMLHLAVADRDGTDTERIAENYRSLYGAKITVCHMEPFDASSTQIRSFLAKDGNSHGLVPKAVEEYIKEHGLYTEEK